MISLEDILMEFLILFLGFLIMTGETRYKTPRTKYDGIQ